MPACARGRGQIERFRTIYYKRAMGSAPERIHDDATPADTIYYASRMQSTCAPCCDFATLLFWLRHAYAYIVRSRHAIGQPPARSSSSTRAMTHRHFTNATYAPTPLISPNIKTEIDFIYLRGRQRRSISAMRASRRGAADRVIDAARRKSIADNSFIFASLTCRQKIFYHCCDVFLRVSRHYLRTGHA